MSSAGGATVIDDVIAGRDTGDDFDTRPGQCDATVEQGGDLPASILVDTQGRGGTADFYFETYDIKDRIWLRAGSQTLYDTGCVGHEETVSVNLPARLPIKVIVAPNCAQTSGTSWKFRVSCPR